MAAATAGCGRWATRPERPGPPESCPAVCAPEGPVCWNCSAGTVCGGRENGSSCCGCCWLSGVWISSCWPEVCCCDRWLLSELSSRCCGPCQAADWLPADCLPAAWDSRWDCEADTDCSSSESAGAPLTAANQRRTSLVHKTTAQ